MGVISTAALDVFFDEMGEVDALLIGPAWARNRDVGIYAWAAAR